MYYLIIFLVIINLIINVYISYIRKNTQFEGILKFLSITNIIILVLLIIFLVKIRFSRLNSIPFKP